MYVFKFESSADYNAEVRIYQKLENAKTAVERRFFEYVKSRNYNATDAAKLESEKEFKEKAGMGFTLELKPFEIVSCNIEEQEFAD